MKFFFLFFLCFSAHAKIYQSESMKFDVETLITREDVVWGFDFLPDGRVIFTERGGKMGIMDPKTKGAVVLKGVPEVYTAGQAGLLDVRVHPDFSKNNLIYFSYSEPHEKGKSTTVIARAGLKGNELTGFKKLFTGWKPNDNDIHYGSRIVFDGKGHIFFTMGDRDDRPKVQDLAYNIGKVMRLNEDGTVPKDNPFTGKKDAKPEIWALGIRSPQGLYYKDGVLWQAEMGPRGGDELNVIEQGKNYGWPIATYGKEYYGPKIAEGTKAGTEQPITYWVPSISPSALTFYTGDKFPQWKDNAFLACLSGQQIRRIVLSGTKVTKQEEILKDLDWRFRNVRTGPDGNLWFSTDEGIIGRLIRK